jgi:hypothetical protein
MTEDGLPLPTKCPEHCNKSPFFVHHAFLFVYLRMSGQTWHVESQEFGPWVQNSYFSFGELHQKNICPVGASHSQVLDSGWRRKMESVP